MKKLILFAVALTSAQALYGQYTSPWPAVSTPNTGQSGYVGIGTKSTTTTTNTPLPNFNLHLHGTSDYTESNNPVFPSGLPQIVIGEIQETNGMVTKSTINYGKTTRFGMTNSTTGLTLNDGVVFRMSENNFSILNREAGNITIAAPHVAIALSSSTKRIWVGTASNHSTSAIYASMNLFHLTDNGLYVQAGSGKYGVRVKASTNSDDALQVFGANSTIKNFKVTGAGEVFARRYTTTLNNIPDYVFEPNYKLLTLDELRSYITTNKHLPNVPSANEFAETGVDLGELNRLLLEKVEELTLYILQLEDRTKRLEDQK
jgi:hypothetical protein